MVNDKIIQEKGVHVFRIQDAQKHGVAKAILLYNLRFWLELRKANKKHVRELNGKKYYWTYNSARAFAELFPYMSSKKISRLLIELEIAGVILSSQFNLKKYDQTKWYTMPEYSTSEPENDEDKSEGAE